MESIEQSTKEVSPQLLEDLKDTIANLTDETSRVASYNTEISNNAQDSVERLESKQEALEAERRTNNQAFRQRRSELATRKAQLDDQIRQLLNLELSWVEELLPDGKVLQTTLDTPYIVINLGMNDGMFNGLRFQIFQYQRGRHIQRHVRGHRQRSQHLDLPRH